MKHLLSFFLSFKVCIGQKGGSRSHHESYEGRTALRQIDFDTNIQEQAVFLPIRHRGHQKFLDHL